MRICFCELHCPHIYCSKSLPCFLQLRDAPVLEEKSSVQKVDCVMDDDKGDNGDDGDQRKEEFILKSSLKKPSESESESYSDSDEIGKRNVKWMDLLGEELVEIREFEPSELEESDDGDWVDSSCMCVIQ